jgi:hypothetical protein
MDKEKRMAGEYEITMEIRVGKREVVFGVNEKSEMPFLCAYYTSNGLFGSYEECMAGDDYLEMVEMFLSRAQEQVNEIRRELGEMTAEQKEVVPAAHCISRDKIEDMTGQIVALDQKNLRPEYRNAANQACLVTHGNGARLGGRGLSVFVKDLRTGEAARYDRHDIIGVIKPEFVRDWMKERLSEITEREKPCRERGDEVNAGYRIIEKIEAEGNTFALGKSETTEQYVTWRCCKDAASGYNWGHYFNSEADARKDLTERAANARENSRKIAENRDTRNRSEKNREDR